MVMHRPPNPIERALRQASVWAVINGIHTAMGPLPEFRQAQQRVDPSASGWRNRRPTSSAGTPSAAGPRPNRWLEFLVTVTLECGWDDFLMAQDDPEQRIADLERQLAERSTAGAPGSAPTGSALTADQVHTVAFSKPKFGKRGYNVDEVDDFLERVEDTLRDPSAGGGVSPADVHDVKFSNPPWGKRGYNEDEVDAFLDVIASELARRPPQRG